MPKDFEKVGSEDFFKKRNSRLKRELLAKW